MSQLCALPAKIFEKSVGLLICRVYSIIGHWSYTCTSRSFLHSKLLVELSFILW